MARPVGGTTNFPPKPVTARPGPEKILFESAFTGGINTSLDPADIQPGEVVDAKNMNCRFDSYQRRAGMNNLVEDFFPPPTVEAVLKLHFHILNDGTTKLLRFAPSSVYYAVPPAWTPIVGVLAGTAADRFNVVSVLDKCVFTNNGKNQIQLIDFGADTFGDLRATGVVDTQYKYCTSIFNRVLAANLTGASPQPTQVGWSAEYPDVDIWDPAVNQMAGFSPLIDSPTDFSDFIMGAHGVVDLAVIPRQRSMWIGRKQPIPTNPFYFQTAIPDIGCNSPYSVAVIPGGMCWADYRTNTIWAWSVGSAPEDIGWKIQKDFWSAVGNQENIFAAYDPINKEYLVGYPMPASDVTRIWVYNFRTKAWTYYEVANCTGISAIPFTIGGQTYDQLQGTYDDLQGTYDDLSPSVQSDTVLYGFNTGDTSYTDQTYNYDLAGFATAAFESYVTSKIFTQPRNDAYWHECRTYYNALTTANLELAISIDGKPFVTDTTLTGVDAVDQRFIRTRKVRRSRTYQFKTTVAPIEDIATNQGQVQLTSYEVDSSLAGESKR